jgi:hypothetical protein
MVFRSTTPKPCFLFFKNEVSIKASGNHFFDSSRTTVSAERLEGRTKARALMIFLFEVTEISALL